MIREWLIKHLINDKQVIINKEEYENLKKIKKEHDKNTKPKRLKRRKTRNKQYIEGEDRSTTGIISKLPDGKYEYYYYNNSVAHRPFRAKRTKIEDAQEIMEKWQKAIKTPEIWKRIINSRPRLHEPKYIYEFKSGYRVIHHQIHFGYLPNIHDAIAVRNYLSYKNWDEKFTSRNLGSKSKMSGNEYYLTMKAIIDMDVEYQKYLAGDCVVG